MPRRPDGWDLSSSAAECPVDGFASCQVKSGGGLMEQPLLSCEKISPLPVWYWLGTSHRCAHRHAHACAHTNTYTICGPTADISPTQCEFTFPHLLSLKPQTIFELPEVLIQTYQTLVLQAVTGTLWERNSVYWRKFSFFIF